MVMLKQKPAPGGESPRSQADNRSATVQTILSTTESLSWFVVANQWVKSLNNTVGDVGRVRNNKIELPPPRTQWFPP